MFSSSTAARPHIGITLILLEYHLSSSVSFFTIILWVKCCLLVRLSTLEVYDQTLFLHLLLRHSHAYLASVQSHRNRNFVDQEARIQVPSQMNPNER